MPTPDLINGGLTQNAVGANANGLVVGIDGQGTVSFHVSGISGGTSVNFEASIDGVNYVALPCGPLIAGPLVTSVTTNGIWTGNCQNLKFVRSRVVWVAGTVTVNVSSSKGL